jgi:hypothetical protein
MVPAVVMAVVTACGGPTLPPGAPDIVGSYTGFSVPIPGGTGPFRIQVREEGTGCSRDVLIVSSTDVVHKRVDGTVVKGSLTGLPIGTSLHIWTRNPPPECPREVVAEVLAILPGAE